MSIAQDIKKNPLPWLLQAISLAALVVALYITTRLAPLSESISNLTTRVGAVEQINRDNREYFDDLIEVKGKVDVIQKTTDRIAEKLGVIK